MRSGDEDGDVWTPAWALRLFLLPAAGAYLLVAPLTWVLNPRFPYELIDIATKYEVFRPNEDDYTTIFLGSSSTKWGVIPKVFDEALRKQGCRQRTFNFAMAGETTPLVYEILKALLRNQPRSLKWVFLDGSIASDIDVFDHPYESERSRAPTLFKPNMIESNMLGNPGFVYWHTFANSLDASRIVLSSDQSVLEKIRLLGTHWITFFRNQVEPGSGPAKVRFELDQLHYETPHSRQIEVEEGYEALYDFVPGKGTRMKVHKLHFTEAAYRREFVLAYERSLKIPAPIRLRYKEFMFRKIVELLASHHIHTIVFVPPRTNPYETLENDIGAPILTYNSPADHPDLFEYKVRLDADHTNNDGAIRLSGKIANDAVKLMGCGAGPPT